MAEVVDQGLYDGVGQPAGRYEFYLDFINEEQALSFAQLLQANKIPFKLDKPRAMLNGTITGYGLIPHAVIKLRTEDFSVANQLRAAEALKDQEFIRNHYFQEYKATELLEVVQTPDEWTPEELALARYLLEKQGIEIPESQVQSYKEQRAEVLQVGKPAPIHWVITYTFFLLAGTLLLSPFFLVGGVGLCWYYWKDKTLDGDGRRYFTYNSETRRWGKNLFYVSWLFLLLAVLVFFYRPYSFRFF